MPRGGTARRRRGCRGTGCPRGVPSLRLTWVRRTRPNSFGLDDRGRCGARSRNAGLLRGCSGHRRRRRAQGRAGRRTVEDEAVVVVLGRDLHHAREQVHDGLVAAVVAVGELLDGGARGHGDASGGRGRCQRRGACRGSCAAQAVGHGRTLSGSPGPLERKTPSGPMASASSAGVSHGTTVTSQPTAARRCSDAALLAAVERRRTCGGAALVRGGHAHRRSCAGDLGDAVVLGDGRGARVTRAIEACRGRGRWSRWRPCMAPRLADRAA